MKVKEILEETKAEVQVETIKRYREELKELLMEFKSAERVMKKMQKRIDEFLEKEME
jgi:hypothetical protein